MKTLILTLLAAFAITAARADVIVQDINNVIIAGANVGKVADAFANHPAKRAEIQTALEAYIAKLTSAKLAAETSLASTQAFAESVVSRAKAALSLRDMTALGDIVSEAEKPAKARKRADLISQKAALEAQIAELQK